jgi:hypothetical protein
MTVAELLVMKRVFEQNTLQNKNVFTELQGNPTKSAVADDTSQTDRRTDEVADVSPYKPLLLYFLNYI